MTGFQLLDLPADRLQAEAVGVFFYEDERPVRGPAGLLDWRLNGQLTRLLLQGAAIGRAGEHVLARNNGKLASSWALFVGGGSRRGLSEGTYVGLVRHLLETCRLAGFSRVAVCLEPFPDVNAKTLERMTAELVREVGGVNLDCRLSMRDDSAGR